MRNKLFAGVMLTAIAPFCVAQETPANAAPPPPAKPGLCLFTGTPPAEFTYVEVRDLKYGKGSFGSVNDILPKLVADAEADGADAVINYNGAQRFGFWPWRFVRPVVTGTAIKWSPARDVDCEAAGGHLTTGSLSEAPPPAR